MRGDRLISDRQARARQPRRTDRRGEVDKAGIARPEKSVGLRHLLAIDRDSPAPAHTILCVIVRVRRGRDDRAKQYVVVPEKRVELQPHMVALVAELEPIAVGHGQAGDALSQKASIVSARRQGFQRFNIGIANSQRYGGTHELNEDIVHTRGVEVWRCFIYFGSRLGKMVDEYLDLVCIFTVDFAVRVAQLDRDAELLEFGLLAPRQDNLGVSAVVGGQAPP